MLKNIEGSSIEVGVELVINFPEKDVEIIGARKKVEKELTDYAKQIFIDDEKHNEK